MEDLSKKTLIISSLLLTILIVVGVVLIVRLWPFLGKEKLQLGTPTSTPAGRVITPEDIKKELRLLE